MRDQIRTFDLLGDPGQPPILQLFDRGIEAGDAEHPHDVIARHRERALESLVDAALPDRVIVPDRAPGYTGLEPRLEGGGAGGIVAAQADPHDADALLVDVGAGLEIVD